MLLQGPQGATLDAATGLLRWTPTADSAEKTANVLRVYDLGGREVIRLAGGESGATGGPQTAARWDGRDARGNAVSAGIYVARLSAGGKSTATRFVVLR